MQTSSVIHSAKPLWSPIKPKPLHAPLVVPQRKTLSFRVKSLYTLPPKDTTFDDRSSAGSMATPPAASPKWAQKTVTLPPLRRGCHLVTSKILKEIAQDLSGFKCGLAHVFLQHTSASLTINENYDTDVRDDTETFLNKIVPEGSSAPWKHTLEGPDDMPAHIKSSMFGCNLTIPITDGRLNMGTWQIWFENVPHPKLVKYKKQQNLVRQSGEYLVLAIEQFGAPELLNAVGFGDCCCGGGEFGDSDCGGGELASSNLGVDS